MSPWLKRPFILFTIALGTTSLLAQSDWPQWRGPNRDGTVSGKAPWPATLVKDNLTLLWEAKLGEGYPGPIVNDQLVFTVASKDGREIVKAFDRTRGEVVWEQSWEGALKVPFFARKNGSWVRSTPAYDAESGLLFVGGMRDFLVALDGKNGEIVWQVDFAAREKTELPGFGFVSSPLVDGDHLYVQAGCAVTKLDKKTGATLWRALEDRRGMYGSAFSSVVLEKIHGKPQLLAQTRSHLAGINPADGSVLWKYEVKAFRGMNILPPTRWTSGGTENVFTASYGGGAFLFAVNSFDAGFAAEKIWNTKIEGYMSSPIVQEEHVYFHGRDKHFHCLALADGQTTWTSEQKFGEYWSAVQQGSRILALDETGDLFDIDLTPERFLLRSQVEISSESPTWAHLAVVGNEIFIRHLTGLRVYRWR